MKNFRPCVHTYAFLCGKRFWMLWFFGNLETCFFVDERYFVLYLQSSMKFLQCLLSISLNSPTIYPVSFLIHSSQAHVDADSVVLTAQQLIRKIYSSKVVHLRMHTLATQTLIHRPIPWSVMLKHERAHSSSIKPFWATSSIDLSVTCNDKCVS